MPSCMGVDASAPRAHNMAATARSQPRPPSLPCACSQAETDGLRAAGKGRRARGPALPVRAVRCAALWQRRLPGRGGGSCPAAVGGLRRRRRLRVHLLQQRVRRPGRGPGDGGDADGGARGGGLQRQAAGRRGGDAAGAAAAAAPCAAMRRARYEQHHSIARRIEHAAARLDLAGQLASPSTPPP